MRSIVLLLALVLLPGCDRQKPTAPQGDPATGQALAPAPEKGVDRSRAGQIPSDIAFTNPDGGAVSLARFKGVPTLVNLWATWCAPCVKELPTLDRLAGEHAVDGQLGVLAVSQDMAPQGSVRAFLARLGVRHLGAYHDDKMALSGGLKADILPTTILLDSQGREVWRYVGDLDWTGREARALLSEAR